MRKSLPVAFLFAIVLVNPAVADDKSHAPMKQGHMTDAKSMPMAQNTAEMADGEIKRISKGSKKLTIKHGEIKNLEMPPMTMVFGVADEKMLEKVKKGDKIRFKAEAIDGQMVVTEIMPQ